MWNLRVRFCVCLVLLAAGLVGCQEAAAPPAAAPAAVTPPATPAPAAAPAVPTGPSGPFGPVAAAPAASNVVPMTPNASTGPAPGVVPVDAAIQEKLLGQAANLKVASESGELTRDELKQIGLAFHNFHDAYNGFPATNGLGKDAPEGQNLSWRVMLLPTLGEIELYRQFHLDEAWDSEHNKTLISRMPKIYGGNREGKTRIHVLTGNGAPFQKDQVIALRDIHDGSSNTILAVVAGPDKAEVWTKPGGLEFEKQAPLKCLGTLGDTFSVIMMDGSSAKFKKTIDPPSFAKLVQHHDKAGWDNKHAAARVAFGAGSLPPLKINAPVTPLAPTASRISVGFIPADAFAVLAVHPRRIYSHPVVKNVREAFPPETIASLGGRPGDVGRDLERVNSLRQTMGFAVEQLDEAVIVLDKDFAEALKNNPFDMPPLGVVIRNSAPFDIDGMAARFANSPAGSSIEEHEGIALLLEPSGASHGIMSPPPGFKPPPVTPPQLPIGPDGKPVNPDDAPVLPPSRYPSKKAAPGNLVVPPPARGPTLPSPKKAAPKAKKVVFEPQQASERELPVVDNQDACQGGAEPTVKAEPAGERETEADEPKPDNFAVAFVSDSVMLVGAEKVVRKMISARNSTSPATELTKQLDAMGNPLLAMAVDSTPVQAR